MSLSEIKLHDLGVRQNFRRGSLPESLTLVQEHTLLRQIPDELQIVLDE